MMNRLFEVIIKPSLELINAKNIVEIGCFDGKNTRNLYDYCRKKEGVLHSVDPSPLFNVEEIGEQYFKFYRQLSLNVLGSLANNDTIILDGDHNWYTVFNELKLIEKNVSPNQFPLVFVHDVSWPYGRRDSYYNPEYIPNAYLKPYAKMGIKRNSSSLVGSGGVNEDQNNAIYEHNMQNGVLTAVEDFIKESEYHYEFIMTPAFYGVGLIIPKQNDRIYSQLPKLKAILSSKEIVRLLENTRTSHIIEINQLNKQIKDQERTLREQDETILLLKNRNNVIEEENKRVIHDLENEISSLKKSQGILQKEISSLKKKLKDSNRLLSSANVAAQTHKNSIRYKLGDVIIGAVKPSKNTIRFPVNVYRLLKEVINKRKGEAQTAISKPPNKQSSSKLNSKRSHSDIPNNISKLKGKNIDLVASNIAKKVSIIIPVYNAYEDVKKCIESVIRNSIGDFEVIIIDDCSTDERLGELYKSLDHFRNIILVRNSTNVGYVESVNNGLKVSSNDVILLNSDTIVTRKWNKKLQMAAYSSERVGTVTPFSNAAGAFSVPEMGQANDIPPFLTVDSFGKLVENCSEFAFPEVPTGNGFCMYIKRSVINQVGLLDSINFKRGYGEENDFCMRALKLGWKHIIDDSTFIYHKRSASFSEEKEELIKKNREILNRLHPEYSGLIRKFINDSNIERLRNKISENLSRPNETVIENKKSVLYVLHQGSGGTPNTNKDLVSYTKRNYDCYILTSNTREVFLWMYNQHELEKIRSWKLSKPWNIQNFRDLEFSRIYLEVLMEYSVDLIHIRHLLAHSFDLPYLGRSIGIKTILSFHDFYFICPTVHLLDDQNVYCAGSCTEGEGRCKISSGWIDDENLNLKHNWIYTWRQKVEDLLKQCDAFVTTSRTSRDVHVSNYSILQEMRFEIIEHGRELEQLKKDEYYDVPSQHKPVKILFPGNIGNHKGVDFIRALKHMDKNGRLEFHFMGQLSHKLKGIGVDHGAYERNDYYKIIRKIKPSFVGIFSIWPETYCHTMSEAWMCGIPVLATKIGTLQERVEQHGGGWLLDFNDPEGSYARILEIANDLNLYTKVKSEVDKIKIRTIQEMGRDYDYLYRCVLSGKKLNRVALFVKQLPAKTYNSSGYIRMMLPLFHHVIRDEVVVEVIDNEYRSSFHMEEYKKYTGVLIQRDCLDMETTKNIVSVAKESGIKIFYEIDDDLLGIDHNHAEFVDYQAKQAVIMYLLENADRVSVSTKNLMKVYQPYNKNIHLIENALDERLWFSPLPSNSRKKSAELTIGYMGTFTHREDLEMVRSAISRTKLWCRQQGTSVRFVLIGGDREKEDVFDKISIPKNSTNYPEFVRWLRENNMIDIGIAPLKDSTLNNSKSALKYLDYSAMSIPAVYSDTLPFKQVIHTGENGLLVSTEDDWVEALKKLVVDANLRTDLSSRAHTDLVRNYLLKDNVKRWSEFINND